MKYKNAQVVLPDALVKELQKYVQGEYIYVENNHFECIQKFALYQERER
ncbi:MAG: hypothetical protein KHZ72_11145 [Lachnospiraceae bacterium]|nr:hypothetical protein [Lachnospiraceae bacterium]